MPASPCPYVGSCTVATFWWSTFADSLAPVALRESRCHAPSIPAGSLPRSRAVRPSPVELRYSDHEPLPVTVSSYPSKSCASPGLQELENKPQDPANRLISPASSCCLRTSTSLLMV